MVVKTMVPFWVPEILGAGLYEGPRKGHYFGSHSHLSWGAEQWRLEPVAKGFKGSGSRV